MGAVSSTVPTHATLVDLARTPGKAELIGGRIVHLMPSGHQPGRVALRIARGLDEHTEVTGRGFAYGDNTGFRVPVLSSGRESFSPDAAYYDGPPPPDRMRFVEGPPTFAVEVRSEGDYGPAAEADMAAKRADYFEAGTLVVWDVDPIAECIHVYRTVSPDRPVTYDHGQEIDAEPAVAGWRMVVDRIFP
jgi:Uma2 family endonuclease